MNNLLLFLDKAFFFLQKLWKAHQEKKWQKENDTLEASPADWFEQHFNGVSTMPTDDKTEQTNITDK